VGRQQGQTQRAPAWRDVCSGSPCVPGHPRLIERLDPDEPNEDRMLLTGLAGDVLLTVCYVERGHRIRIISARKATQREQDDYNQANA
jgi:uncharacterized DUF497 family protein